MSAPVPYYETPAGAPSRVRLYHGDCREVLPLVAPPEKRVIVLADPMYGIGVNTTGRHKGAHVIRRGDGRISGRRRRGDLDYPPMDDLTASNVTWLLDYERLGIWGFNYVSNQVPPSPSLIVWDKRDGVTQDNGADAEVMWTNLGGPLRIFRYLWRGVCQAGEKATGRIHPCQKPVDFYRWLFSGRGRGKPAVNPGDLVVVPYLGSGPEIPAAMELGLEVIGVDVERQYLDTAIKHRIEPELERGRQLDIWKPKPPRAEQAEMFAQD